MLEFIVILTMKGWQKDIESKIKHLSIIRKKQLVFS